MVYICIKCLNSNKITLLTTKAILMKDRILNNTVKQKRIKNTQTYSYNPSIQIQFVVKKIHMYTIDIHMNICT